MKRHHIVERDFVAGINVAQSVEEYVVVEDFHVAVGLTGMVDVMRAVTPAAAVYAPITIDGADTQSNGFNRAQFSFEVRLKLRSSKTWPPVVACKEARGRPNSFP